MGASSEAGRTLTDFRCATVAVGIWSSTANPPSVRPRADAPGERDLLVDGQQGGLANLLEIELQVGPFAMGNGFGGGGFGLFEKGRRRIDGRGVQDSDRCLSSGGGVFRRADRLGFGG